MADPAHRGELLDIVERLARVEERVDLLLPIAEDVHAIKQSVSGRAGFVAGVVAAVSFLWALALGVWNFLGGTNGG